MQYIYGIYIYVMYIYIYIPPWSRVLPQTLTVTQLVRKFPAFYGARRFITVLKTCPFPEQINPVPASSSHFLKIHLILSSHLHLGLPLRCPHQNSVRTSPVPHSATCPTHLIIFYLLTQIIFGEEYRS